MVNKPNLFIVGAPKCGTSFMYEFLATHPQVFMCPTKEPNYFDKDLNYISPRLSKEEYLNLFKKVATEKIIGEASPWYLYSSSAPSEIHNFNPDSKIIIMLRNPIDYMYSLYSENIYQGNEIIENFEEALATEEDRKNNKNVFSNSNPKEGVYYRTTATYSPQVKRYLEKFGRNNVHTIIFDDLKSTPDRVCDEVLKFLSLDYVRPITNAVNPNKEVKNKLFREIIMRPPNLFRQCVRILIPIHSLRIRIQDSLKRINTKNVKRNPLDHELSNTLKKEFKEEIVQLSKLLERDLSYWIK